MKYPHVRYADHDALVYYAAGWRLSELAKHLKRDKRTIRRWLSGEYKAPWFIPTVLKMGSA
jgi:predicted transcriptional regulator